MSKGTHEKYLGDDFYVVMAGDKPPDFVVEVMERRHEERVNDPDNPLSGPDEFEMQPARDHHALNPDAVVDGWVTFYDPELLEQGEAFKHYQFPFRDHRKDDAPWEAKPDAPKWERHPIWKWTNPGADPHEHLTLKPSLGVRGDDGIGFHCYIRSGEIEWL